jgi:hypothetical protein
MFDVVAVWPESDLQKVDVFDAEHLTSIINHVMSPVQYTSDPQLFARSMNPCNGR